MAILTKADLKKLRKLIVLANPTPSVVNMLDTCEAYRAALEAWVKWCRAPQYHDAAALEQAVELTIAAGIVWGKDSS